MLLNNVIYFNFNLYLLNFENLKLNINLIFKI